jgi:hypothetical protein
VTIRSKDQGRWALVLASIIGTMSTAAAGPLTATVGSPASVPLVRSQPKDALSGSRASIIVSVAGYQPPREGAVEVVVKAQLGKGGAEHEVGRFGIMPQASFSAKQPERMQRFRLIVPPNLDLTGLEKLEVYVTPTLGDGAGARVEIKDAKME